ncbi:ANTAR domain-containing protein [Streptomyces sp. NPDC055085]
MSQLLTLGHGEQPPGRPDNEHTPQPGQPLRQGTVQAVVERATGVVMALGRLDAGQAGLVLSAVSRRTGIAQDRLAELLTVWAPTGDLNLGLRIALEEAIRDQHRARPPRVDPVPGHPGDRTVREGGGHAVPRP